MGSLPLPTPQEALRHLDAWAGAYRKAPCPASMPFLPSLQGLYQAVHTTKGSLELCQPPAPDAALAQQLLDRLRKLATGTEVLSPSQDATLRRLCAAPGLNLRALDEALPKVCALANDVPALDGQIQQFLVTLDPEPKLDAFARARLREALRQGYGLWTREETRALTDLEAQDAELHALLAPLGGFLVLRALRPPSTGKAARKLNQFQISTFLVAAVPAKTAAPKKASGWKRVSRGDSRAPRT